VLYILKETHAIGGGSNIILHLYNVEVFYLRGVCWLAVASIEKHEKHPAYVTVLYNDIG
jgi:hypothetical protein